MNKEAQRNFEIKKYHQTYQRGDYGMGQARQIQAHNWLIKIKEIQGGSLLDVGTGRGEVLGFARGLEFDPVQGTEVVPDLIIDGIRYAEIHDLPFEADSFDVVTCFDVLEHINPFDTAPALAELARVAKTDLLLTVENRHSRSLGVELHVNRRPYTEWETLMQKHTGGRVVKMPDAPGTTNAAYWITF
jgi:ubiquinone/menaquinone biosynthesis C-methylase UbiE